MEQIPSRDTAYWRPHPTVQHEKRLESSAAVTTLRHLTDSVRVVRGGVGRIGECLLPRFDAFWRKEFDMGKEVFSSVRNP